MSGPSVVCLSSVCDVGARYQRVEIFGNILHHLIAQVFGHFVLKFVEKFEGVQGDRASQIQWGTKNWRFSSNISLYFENSTKYGHSYNGRQRGPRVPSIE